MFSKFVRFLVIICIMCLSYFYFSPAMTSNWLTDTVNGPTTSASNNFASPLCNCSKVIPIVNEKALNQSSRFSWCSLESDLRGGGQRVVTYVLFGDSRNETIFLRYFSLMSNIALATERMYPGWTVRFYHDFTRDNQVAYKTLCDVYCQFPHVDLCSFQDMCQNISNSSVPIEPKLMRGLNKRMIRFLVMLDPLVDVFISRDIDSFIYQREVDAVSQWLQSNYTFHVMRDHIKHTAVVLAGMWGAKVSQKRSVIQGLARRLISAGQNQLKPTDQSTLRAILWPVAKSDVIAHDAYHCRRKEFLEMSPLKSVPFPTQRNGSFVGGVGQQKAAQPCPVECRPTNHKDWEFC